MRSIYTLVAVAISLSVIVAVVVALWVVGSESGQRDRFSTLEIVPRDVGMYVAINTDPTSSQWLAVNDVLDTLNASDSLLEAINEALAEFHLEWERDILPLAGDEAFFALTDFDSLDDGSGWVMGFQLRDPDRAEEIFLDIAAQTEQEDGEVLREEEYEGERIYYFESQFGGFDAGIASAVPGEGALAFVGDVFAIGFSQDDVKGIIDVIQGRSASAQQNERLQEVRLRQEDDFLFWGYVDMGLAWDALEEELEVPPFGTDLSPKDLLAEAREQADRLSFALSAHRHGFVLDSFVFQSPESQEEAPSATVFESRYAETVPADTLFFAAGYDLFNGLYVPLRDAIAETAVDPDSGETVDDLLDAFQEEIGVDFEDDMLGLLTGEFAVAFDASDFDSDLPQFDVMALFDVTDPGRMKETMLRLGDYFEELQLLAAQPSEREGVYTWGEYGGSDEAVAWTVTDESFAVGYPESAVNEFLDGPSPSLADDSNWTRTMDLLPDDKTFVMYLSVARLLEEIRKFENIEEQLLESTDGDVTFDDLMRIRSVGMAATTADGGSGFTIAVLVQE